MTPSSFPNEPTVLTGAASRWPALQRWTWVFFAQMADTELVLVTPDGEPGGRATVGDYVEAIQSRDANRYDRLYAAGWRFFENRPAMMRDFEEPEQARDDALQRIPMALFQPLLWLFIGGDGSGTMLHHDVLATHAWLAVLAGRKRFALHPPAAWDDCFEARQRESAEVLTGRRDQRQWRYLEVEPGDIILIPSRWWHAVVNEGPTIGLTRNIATPEILTDVAAAARAQQLVKLLPWLIPHGEADPCSSVSAIAT